MIIKRCKLAIKKYKIKKSPQLLKIRILLTTQSLSSAVQHFTEHRRLFFPSFEEITSSPLLLLIGISYLFKGMIINLQFIFRSLYRSERVVNVIGVFLFLFSKLSTRNYTSHHDGIGLSGGLLNVNVLQFYLFLWIESSLTFRRLALLEVD